MAKGKAGERVIVVQEYKRRQKDELRAKIQETTHRYTALLRQELQRKWREGWRVGANGLVPPPDTGARLGEEIPPGLLDALQPAIEEYDPVVELALIAVDYGNEPNLRRLANTDAAPYLRAKMASIRDPDLEDDENGDATLAQKGDVLDRLLSAMGSMVVNKVTGNFEEAVLIEGAPPAAPSVKKNSNGHATEEDSGL